MREWREPRGSEPRIQILWNGDRPHSSALYVRAASYHGPPPEDPRREGRRQLKPISLRTAADSDPSSTGTSSSRSAPPPCRVPISRTVTLSACISRIWPGTENRLQHLGLDIPILEKAPALWDLSLGRGSLLRPPEAACRPADAVGLTRSSSCHRRPAQHAASIPPLRPALCGLPSRRSSRR